MKKHIRKNSAVSVIISLLLAFALVISSFMPPMASVSYAEADAGSSVSNDAEESDAEEPDAGYGRADDGKTSKKKTVTQISSCAASYNKLIGEPLEISADIYPAGGREVQLQRYNSSDESWSVIRTVTADEAAEETEGSSADEITADTEESSADEITAESEESSEDEITEATEDPSEDEAAAETSGSAANVSIAVSDDERSNTESLWRLYVPATDDAEEAYSENITVISENLKELDLSARTACIYRIDNNGEGTRIYSKNADMQHAQASTTKLMTAVLLLESGLIDGTTEISGNAASTPWGSGRLAAGDVYSNRDLLYAMLLPSANDAATAIAESVGGSEERFVIMMNAKANKMGLANTHFCNPHGLDADGHYTTATELAKLTAYAYTFPEIRECWATKYKTIKSLNKGRKWTLWSTNAIFGYISEFLGGKTGTEDNAGCCFTGVYTHNGSVYVTVVLGSGYGFSRWSDTKKLHQYIRDYAATSY